MSWLFSQALVAEYSAVTCSGGVPSAPLNVMPTPHKFWRNDKTMEPSQLSRFGLTCAVLTEDHGAALLTWFLADSRVRTYQLPGMVTVSTVLAQVSGEKWRESSARYDLITSTWKTHLCLWDEDLPWSSVTLPKWGMTRAGALFQHPIAERPISAIASGLWPTPPVHGNHNQPGSSKTSGWGLSSAVKLWQTPVADDAVSRPQGKWNSRGEPKLSAQVRPSALHGQLNPDWVEWLMGWPTGWTDLKPLAMDKFREWQQQHSPSYRSTTDAA